MANHKKKRPPNRRAHCHMCKPWKDGVYGRDSEGFESHSAHVARQAVSDDQAEEKYPKASKKISNIKKRTGKNKPRCRHSWTPWGLVESGRISLPYPSFYASRRCRNCAKEEKVHWWARKAFSSTGAFWPDEELPDEDIFCLEHEYVTIEWKINSKDEERTICRFCGEVYRD